jgi:hypothetical protein
MLNPDIPTVVADLVDGALASRDRSIGLQIQAKQNMLASQGMGQSGRAVFELAEVANEELRTIAATLWTALLNALRAMPPSPGPQVQNDVRATFLDMFSARYDALQAAFSGAFHVGGGDRAKAAGVDMVHKTYEALSKRYSAEIALWAAAYNPSHLNAQPLAPQYVFNAPVGTVQTGANSTANVTQNLAGADLAPLIASLNRLIEEISQVPNVDPESQRQAVELNRDIVSALQAPQRNTYRLLGLFNGLATFVQTLGAVPAAYSEIQSIATALGLM